MISKWLKVLFTGKKPKFNLATAVAGQNALNLIKEFEGFSEKAYKCPAGKWTIGYGSTKFATGRPVKKGDTLIQPSVPGLPTILPQVLGEDLLKATLKEYEDAIKRDVIFPLTQNQYDALVSFYYNLGTEALNPIAANGKRKATSTLNALNSGDTKLFAKWFLKWDKANGKALPGLTLRRNAELALFLEGELNRIYTQSELRKMGEAYRERQKK